MGAKQCNLFTALDHIANEKTRPQSQSFAKQLRLQLSTYQGSDDSLELKDINATLKEWKEADLYGEWPEEDIDNPVSRSMTYVLQLAHASDDQRQCFFFNEFSRLHEERKLPCRDHLHYRGHQEGSQEFKCFMLLNPFCYTIKTWGELSDITYLLRRDPHER